MTLTEADDIAHASDRSKYSSAKIREAIVRLQIAREMMVPSFNTDHELNVRRVNEHIHALVGELRKRDDLPRIG